MSSTSPKPTIVDTHPGDRKRPKPEPPVRTGTKKASGSGHWTRREHVLFLEALALYGKDWIKVREHVATRTAGQVRSHAQKYFAGLQRDTAPVSARFVPANPPSKTVMSYQSRGQPRISPDMELECRPGKGVPNASGPAGLQGHTGTGRLIRYYVVGPGFFLGQHGPVSSPAFSVPLMHHVN